MPDRTAPTVLIVDNDEAVVLAVRKHLEKAGITCLPAFTGSEALEIFRNRTIDLVLTDLNMPDGDGIALASSIRQLGDVPIIIATGFHGDYRRELRSIPNVSLFQKPFDFNQLLDAIEAELTLRGRSLW